MERRYNSLDGLSVGTQQLELHAVDRQQVDARVPHVALAANTARQSVLPPAESR